MTGQQIRKIGVVLLWAGMIAAVVICFLSPPDETRKVLGIDIRTNRDRNQLERMGGRTYVMLKDFDDWFGGLWHGRRLGWTVGVLSALGFLLSRGLARVQEDYLLEQAAEAARNAADGSGAGNHPPGG